MRSVPPASNLPRLRCRADQAELERAGANDVDQVMSRPTRRSGPNRCAAAALAEVAGARFSYVRRPERLGACWRLRQSKAVLSALTRRIHERMTEGVAHGRVTATSARFRFFADFKEVISQNDV